MLLFYYKAEGCTPSRRLHDSMFFSMWLQKCSVATGAPGTPRSMKQTAAVEESPPELTNRGYQNRSGGPKPKSIRSRSHSRKASLSLPEIPPLVGASASTDRLSVGLTGLTAADSCLGVNQQYLNTNPQLSNLHDSSNFHGATADRLIGHLSDAASVPMSTKGAVRGEVQVGGSQKAPADFSSVYFFSPGLMTDSEVGESHAFGMVGVCVCTFQRFVASNDRWFSSCHYVLQQVDRFVGSGRVICWI